MTGGIVQGRSSAVRLSGPSEGNVSSLADLQSTIPPQHTEAEQCVLGSMLLDKQVIDEVSEVLDPGDFYLPEHEKVFKAIVALHDSGRPVDLVLLTEELTRQEELVKVGGVDVLVALMESVPNASHAMEYSRLVRQAAERRRIIDAAQDILKAAWSHTKGDVTELVNAAEERLFAATQGRGEESAAPLSQLIRAALERIDAAQESDPAPRGLATRFTDLDAKLNGLAPGGLYVVAGRPSMGKSSFAVSMMDNISVRDRNPGLLFTLEVTKEQVAENMLCGNARVDATRLMRGDLTDEEYRKIPEAAGRLMEAPFYIDDTPGLSLVKMRAKARRMKARHDISIIMVDYLQLMTLGGNAESRQMEITRLSGGMKQMARELKVPVLVLSQLNRAVESRPNKRPMMSDLRESGAIEQDADAIMLLYREEYYNPDDSTVRGKAEIIVAKNRTGPTGTVNLFFFPTMMRFENPTYIPDDVSPAAIVPGV